MNYPDNVLVVRLTADQPGALNFKLRPEVAYVGRMHFAHDGCIGSSSLEGHTVILRTNHDYFNVVVESQIQVINKSGSITSTMENEKAAIHVAAADRATIMVAADSNYELKPSVFKNLPAQKLEGNPDLHEEVTARLADAMPKGYSALKQYAPG